MNIYLTKKKRNSLETKLLREQKKKPSNGLTKKPNYLLYFKQKLISCKLSEFYFPRVIFAIIKVIFKC